MDSDVKNMNLDQAKAEIMKLRDAIRYHMKQEGHDRCWLDDLKLYSELPEGNQSKLELPRQEEFLENCKAYWCKRQPLIDLEKI